MVRREFVPKFQNMLNIMPIYIYPFPLPSTEKAVENNIWNGMLPENLHLSLSLLSLSPSLSLGLTLSLSLSDTLPLSSPSSYEAIYSVIDVFKHRLRVLHLAKNVCTMKFYEYIS